MQWEEIVRQLRSCSARSEVSLSEVGAPTRLAPDAFAIAAEVNNADGEIVAEGKFILLHDHSAPVGWNGTLRAVTFLSASIEPEMASDPLLADVVWSWLADNANTYSASRHSASGTVTRTISKSFGELHDNENEVELRASWTPASSEVLGHLLAWLDTLCQCAGLEPTSDGVTQLRRRSMA